MYTHVLHTIDIAPEDNWGEARRVRFADSPLKWCAVKWAQARVGHRVLMFLTCVDESQLEEMEAEALVRDEIRHCMTEHTRGSGVAVVNAVINQVRKEQGYELSDASDFIFEQHTVAQFETKQKELGLTDGQLERIAAQRNNTAVIPRFAAATIIALRSKFGGLGNSPANVMLIEREYLRICREAHVRACDTESHRQFVLNGYFSEDVHSRLATIRTRVPKWMRNAFRPTEPASGPQVC